MQAQPRRLICLAAALILTATFWSCGGEKTPTETTAATEAATTAPAPVLDLIVNGEARYTIVRSERLAADSPQLTYCRFIRTELGALTGADVAMGTDWIRPGGTLDSEACEILVGFTDYPETKQVMETVAYGDWAIRAIGNKIVIFAYDNNALSRAVSAFIRVAERGISADGKSISLSPESLIADSTAREQLSALPVFAGGRFEACYAAGNGCDEVILRDTTPALYDDYLQSLAAAGYRKYTAYQMGDNRFTTFTSDKYTVTAGYYAYEDTVRLLIEPLAPAVGLEADNVYTKVTTTQMTMLGQEYTDEKGEPIANGQSLLIRLCDGRFVIIDGGHSRVDVAQELVRVMREQAADYLRAGDKPTVAAWIVTHPHTDHFGALIGQTGGFRDIKVEKILVNFLSAEERERAIKSSTVGKNWGESEGSGYLNIPKVAKQLGAEVRNVHVGQVYYFADAKFEVLYTIESYAPRVCNALNTGSVVMKIDMAGTTYLSTGDATGDAMEVCADMYGDYLRADIVQVAHHGSTTYDNDNGVMKAYRLANSATVLWPRSFVRYDIGRAGARNAVLYDAKNYKEDFVAGKIGDRVVLPMPYTPGQAIVTRVN